MTLAQIIKNLRNNLKLSQRDLAKELNISPSSIAMYETGQRTPDTETLKLLADFFNTSTDYLLGRTEDAHPIPHDPANPSSQDSFHLPERLQVFYKKVEELSPESLKLLEQQVEYLQQLESEIFELKKQEDK